MSVPGSRDDQTPPLEKRDSKKYLETGDEMRRNRFRERSKNLERGVSAPAFNLPFSSKNTSSNPKAPMPLTEEEAVTVGQGIGHEFVKKTYFQPTYCHHCSELLWGIKGQGLSCTGNYRLSILQHTHIPPAYFTFWRLCCYWY